MVDATKKIGEVVVCLSERTGGRWCGQNARRRAPFIAMHRVRATRACTKEREGGDNSRQQSDRVCTHAQQGIAATTLCGSDAEGICLYVIGMGELDRGGQDGHAARTGLPVHST
jgi:hypothetical protein